MHKENTPPQEVRFCDGEAMLAAFGDYVGDCAAKGGFPNLAGFGRFCGVGDEGLARLRRAYPCEMGLILTALEDEALNADKSPALVTAYLKHRLGYGECGGLGEPEVILVDRALADDGE